MKKLFCFFASLAVLFALSCKVNTSSSSADAVQAAEESDLVTPYSDMSEELLISMKASGGKGVAADPDVVDWKVARFFAVLEKIEFEATYPWKGAKVSEKPVVIYYPESEKPRYYEFRVIKNGKEVGSITCNASKKEGDPVAYVSEITHQVSRLTARELLYDKTYKLSAVNYPTSLVMAERTSTASLDTVKFINAENRSAIDQESVFIDKPIEAFLKEASAETLNRYEITMEEKSAMLAECSEQREYFQELWAEVEKDKAKMISITDEEIEAQFASLFKTVPQGPEIGLKRIEAVEEKEVYRRMLYPWYDKKDWIITLPQINRDPWCGPAAVTFVTLGLGENSGCPYVPYYYESEKITALYDKFEARIGTGAKLIKHLNYGMQALTNYKVEKKLCHRWNDVDLHLANYKLPVISLRSGWYGGRGGGAFHYRVIIGTAIDRRIEHHVIGWWFFGWRSHRWTKTRYSNWYYMHDNGGDSKSKYNYNVDGPVQYGNFWEKSGLCFQSTLGLVKHK